MCVHANTLPETNSSPLKIDGLNTSFLLGWPIFRGYVSFREGTAYGKTPYMYNIYMYIYMAAIHIVDG